MRILHLVVIALVALLVGCGGPGAKAPMTGLTELRRAGPDTRDPEVAARWLFAELFAAGGQAKQAQRARARLDALDGEPGMEGHLARGLDDWAHGRLVGAPDHFLAAVVAARTSKDPRAPLVAWLAARQAVLLRANSPGLWQRWELRVDEMIEQPLGIGWRARSELVDWWSLEQHQAAKSGVEAKTAARFGCATALRLAGPFGTNTKRDLIRAHAAEEPGPWPPRWPQAPGRGEAPRVLATDHNGCYFYADEPVGPGVFYAETFVEVAGDREVLIAVQGALAVWVDDHLVLDRDPRKWGVWPNFGVELWLPKGRHRVLARLDGPSTSIRLADPDGRPAPVTTSTDGAPLYAVLPPRLAPNPNYVSRYVKDGNVVDPGDALTRFLLAYLAFADDQGDVASVFFEPFVKDLGAATGPALVLSALFAEQDTVYPPTQVQDLVREVQTLAVEKDPSLWAPRLGLALFQADQAGPTKVLAEVRKLRDEFPEVPTVAIALARLYARLGWTAEYTGAVKELARRFPESDEVLSLAVGIYDDEGDRARVDELVARIQKLDPDSELVLTRALEREDYDLALAELKRLGERRPDRKDIAERIDGVLVRKGERGETWKQLEAAIAKEPKDVSARLALADARFAAGQNAALRQAVVDSVTAGAPVDQLEAAIDLVEGVTELEPYRIPALPVIAAYEASGLELPGHAARVLDYMAVWVKSDGSARLLEHEVVKIQSAEAIGKMAEHERLSGLPLHMRVIKRDGRVLEPEVVPGKPTVTFPHLEVGDYIETEHIFSTGSDGEGGAQYVGPHWFFREANVAYARSEFVVISPKGKDLQVEYGGGAPEPQREDDGVFEVRRWRVDQSPAALMEPGSPPLAEFLPSVRIGWGINAQSRLRRLHDQAVDLTPVDPRIVRIAQRIVEPAPPEAVLERAQKLYRWVLANVEEGEESDGRRAVIGKEGQRSRAFETLCRALSIDVAYAAAKNRLAPPPRGPISQALLYDEVVMRVASQGKVAWLTVGNKFAPFGYVPVEVRGMPAYLLSGARPQRTVVPADGSVDGVEYVGTVKLAADGSARAELTQRFLGRHAMGARSELAEVPEKRLPDLLQALIAQSLRGAILTDQKVSDLDALDAPLALEMSLEMSQFAQLRGGTLVIQPPFPTQVSAFTALPRRETPLLLAFDTYQRVKLSITLPPGAQVTTKLAPDEVKLGDAQVTVKDRLDGQTLVLDRTVFIPAGRVKVEDYAAFVDFARRADEAQAASIRVTVP